jgi:hypothetical protein
MSIHLLENNRWRFFARRPRTSAIRDGEQIKWHWVPMALFPVGFLLTFTVHGDNVAYILLTLLAVVACGFLLKRLRGPLRGRKGRHVVAVLWQWRLSGMEYRLVHERGDN